MSARISNAGQIACLKGLIETDRQSLMIKYQRMATLGREYLALSAEAQTLESHVQCNVQRLHEIERVTP